MFAGFYEIWDTKPAKYPLLPESFKNYYDETLQLWSSDNINKIVQNSNGTDFEQNAIVVKNGSSRAWASNKPLFRDPKKPGEGYPFDYAQHSALYIGMPIKILKQSVDGSWYFGLTPVNYGWFEKDIVAFTNSAIEEKIKNMPLCTPLNDDEIMKNSLNTHLKVGMVLPCDENSTFIPSFDLNKNTILIESPKLPQIPVSQEVRVQTALTLLGKHYGWGGIYGDRDCSALTRDVFISSGVFLKRNSRQQAAPNELGYIDLSKMDIETKKSTIIKTAIAWQTLLYMPGHIVLYIGHENGEPLIYHAIWSIKLFDFFGNESRHLIGKTVITNLDVNSSLQGFDEAKSSLAPKITGMRIITQ